MKGESIIPNISEHKQEKTIKEVIIYPEHVNRTESEEFKRSKQRLQEDGHFKCFVCGTANKLEVHHFGCEWALANDCDYDKLKHFLRNLTRMDMENY